MSDHPEGAASAGRLIGAEPARLAELVEYGEGSIVSRTLHENAAGTLTVFAFDSGQALSEHSVPFDAVVHVVDGEVELTIGGKTVRAVEGHVVLMPANVPHAVRAVQRFKMALTMFKAG